MNVRSTSIQAFGDIQPRIGEKQQVVVNALIRFGPMTNTEIAHRTKNPINTITPRTNELVKMGIVAEIDRRSCKITGKKAIVWSYVDQENLI